MADDGAATQQGEQQQDGGDSSGFTPPATQQELNRIISERVSRERSKMEAKFSDYEALRTAAAEYAKLQESTKSESEKLAERIAAADAAAAKVPQLVAEQLRTALVGLHSISDEDAELFLTASDPALLRRQADRLVAQRAESTATAKKQGNHVPREGTTTPIVDNDERAVARQLFGG